ncbi:MAG: helix-hairpin-helix domain-containing protein [Acidobacteriia bacterium]|nr:helix-hairpin-helix domain-containing protein [Terriglobia bacterium]
MDINQASEADFAKLPGIGPKLARRIVAFREKHGPFRRVEDLLAIRGIGHKKWRKIRPYLQVRDEAGKK